MGNWFECMGETAEGFETVENTQMSEIYTERMEKAMQVGDMEMVELYQTKLAELESAQKDALGAHQGCEATEAGVEEVNETKLHQDELSFGSSSIEDQEKKVAKAARYAEHRAEMLKRDVRNGRDTTYSAIDSKFADKAFVKEVRELERLQKKGKN